MNTKLSGYMENLMILPTMHLKAQIANQIYNNVDLSFPKNVKLIITEKTKNPIVRSVTGN